MLLIVNKSSYTGIPDRKVYEYVTPNDLHCIIATLTYEYISILAIPPTMMKSKYDNMTYQMCVPIYNIHWYTIECLFPTKTEHRNECKEHRLTLFSALYFLNTLSISI